MAASKPRTASMVAVAAVFALWLMFSSAFSASPTATQTIQNVPATIQNVQSDETETRLRLLEQQLETTQNIILQQQEQLKEATAAAAAAASAASTTTAVDTTSATPATLERKSWRFPADMPFIDAIATCETLECVRDAHLQPRNGAKYNFPHFFIAGWPKCATTSLYQHIHHHPDVITLVDKEPKLLSTYCRFYDGVMWCPDDRVASYINSTLMLPKFVKSKGMIAPFEATPNTMGIGLRIADALYKLMPWLKFVASMREPISRHMSYLIMYKERGSGCMTHDNISYCMMHTEKVIERNDTTSLDYNPRKATYGTEYSRQLKFWLNTYPADQILLIQYEDLIGENADIELRKMKEFIDIDPDLPEAEEAAFGVTDQNCRKCRINPEGWDMEEEVYRKLIDMVKPDVEETLRLIEKYKVGDAKRWRAVWQKVWDDNLATCVDGICKVKPS